MFVLSFLVYILFAFIWYPKWNFELKQRLLYKQTNKREANDDYDFSGNCVTNVICVYFFWCDRVEFPLSHWVTHFLCFFFIFFLLQSHAWNLFLLYYYILLYSIFFVYLFIYLTKYYKIKITIILLQLIIYKLLKWWWLLIIFNWFFFNWYYYI